MRDQLYFAISIYLKYHPHNQCVRWPLNLVEKLSPLTLIASYMSFAITVTLFAWIAHKFVSSKRLTRNASDAYYRAKTAPLWNLISAINSCAIYLTTLWNGSFRINKSVVFWYLLIYLRATVPGRNRITLLTYWGGGVTAWAFPENGADFLAAFCANFFLGCLVACFIATLLLTCGWWWLELAVCFVLAIWEMNFDACIKL